MRTLTRLGLCLVLAGLGACGSDAATDRGRQSSSLSDDVTGNPTAGRTGPLEGGGASSCVEPYSPRAVPGRAFAFDGVVVEVGPSVSDRPGEASLGLAGVTFEVREWFAGGRSRTVTVDLQPPSAGDEESVPSDAYGVGSRLLVSGEPRWGGAPLETPIAWACGFTRYHDATTAAQWRRAFAG